MGVRRVKIGVRVSVAGDRAAGGTLFVGVGRRVCSQAMVLSPHLHHDATTTHTSGRPLCMPLVLGRGLRGPITKGLRGPT